MKYNRETTLWFSSTVYSRQKNVFEAELAYLGTWPETNAAGAFSWLNMKKIKLENFMPWHPSLLPDDRSHISSSTFHGCQFVRQLPMQSRCQHWWLLLCADIISADLIRWCYFQAVLSSAGAKRMALQCQRRWSAPSKSVPWPRALCVVRVRKISRSAVLAECFPQPENHGTFVLVR